MLFEFRGSFRARARRSMRHAGRRVPAESRRFGEYPPSHSIDDLRTRTRDRTDELLQLALFFLRRNQSWLIVSRATPPPPPLAPLSSHSPSVPLSASLSHGVLLTTCPTHATHGASTSRLGPRLPAAASSGRVPASPTSASAASASETAEISPLLPLPLAHRTAATTPSAASSSSSSSSPSARASPPGEFVSRAIRATVRPPAGVARSAIALALNDAVVVVASHAQPV